jgi:hypothetical protein
MRSLAPLALCVLVLAFGVSSASAQSGGRPYRGLFSGGVGGAEQLLVANLSFAAGYDDDVSAELAEQGGAGNPHFSRSSSYGSLKGGLRYSLSRRRASLGASFGSSLRVYGDEIGGSVSTHSASAGATFQVARSTSLTLGQTFSYQPFLSILPFPVVFEPELGDARPPDQDLATTDAAYLVYSSTAGLSHSLSRRGSLGLSYGYTKSDFTNDDSRYGTQHGSIRYTHGLGKGFGFYAGYHFTEASYFQGGDSRTLTGQGLDVGLDYSRALSISRRTTLAFGTGSTAVTDGELTQYGVIGNIRLGHQIGRTWAASVSYVRSAQFVEAFADPYFADSISTGLLHRRLQFSTSVATSVGTVGLATSSGFDNYVAQSSLLWAAGRYLAVGVNHTYYRYFLESGTLLSESVPTKRDRQSISAFVSVWAPILHRRGRSS